MKYSKNLKLAIVLAITFLTLMFALFFALPPSFDESEILNTAVEVIDGDTFRLYTTNGIQIIRLLCVDTPEKGYSGYEEAKLFLESLILNKEVSLKSSITDKDNYGRLLRYVYVNEGKEELFVNKLILDNDYGQLLVIPPETCEELN